MEFIERTYAGSDDEGDHEDFFCWGEAFEVEEICECKSSNGKVAPVHDFIEMRDLWTILDAGISRGEEPEGDEPNQPCRQPESLMSRQLAVEVVR